MLTFGKCRKNFPNPDIINDRNYIVSKQIIHLPNFYIGKNSVDYYGIPDPNTKNWVVAEIVECKSIFFKYLFNSYTRSDFKMEVYNLEERYPQLHLKYPQGLVYFTRDNGAERTYIQNAIEYEQQKTNRKLTCAYDEEEDRYLKQPAYD